MLFQGDIDIFSESARVRGKAQRAGNGRTLVKRWNAVHGRGQPRPLFNILATGTPVRTNHRVMLPCHRSTMPAVASLVLGAHRRSEYANTTLKEHL